MIRSALVRRQLFLVVTAVLIMGSLTALVYSRYARNVFANSKAQELDASAQRIAVALASDTPNMLYEEWSTTTFFLDAQVIIVFPDGTYFPENVSQQSMPSAIQVEKVLSGGSVADARGALMLSGNLVVGRPIKWEDGTVLGAVFISKKLTELSNALNSMNQALLVSMLAAIGVLLVPTYVGARLNARPLYQMRNVALRMARGDFSSRANEHAPGEYGELGASLNLLSERLSSAIYALELERSRLASIVDGLGEGIVAIDANERVTHCNPALLQMFGHEADVHILHPLMLIPDESLWTDFHMTVQGRSALIRSMTVGERVLRVTITPLDDGEGNCEGAVGLFRDVTEQERLEQTRRDYVANVSHELRTPISSVRGLAEALNDGLIRNEEDRQRYYGFILRETMRLSRLIEDLLELSRLQSGNMAVTAHEVPSDELLYEFYDRYRQIAEDVGIDLRLDVPKECPKLMTNADRVEQVLVVFLDNAIKFTPADGRITLRMEVFEEFVRIEVEDTGSGIKTEDLPHVFDRFYKADESHSGNGTGLGLSIAREIMQLLDEEIGVESEPGQGATFWFTVHRA